MKKYFYLLAAFLMFTGQAVHAQNSDFPGRSTYPDVNTYTTGQLDKSYHDVIIIDVRTPYEYDTLHIGSAINIPLSTPGFAERVKATRGDNRPIVFYCNGHSCFKSYKAVIKARRAKTENLFAYDSGVFDWAKAHPEKSAMFGSSPIDPSKLLSDEALQEYMLEPADFMARVDENTVILDIREPAQRGLLELFPFRQKNISLGRKDKLVKLLNKVKAKGQKLMVYDESGVQVRWLQYYLEDKGVTNYYFMSGGAKKYFAEENKS